MKYYQQIGPYILKYLSNHSLGLYSVIYNVDKEGIYIGGMRDNYPQWLKVFRTVRKNPKPCKNPYVESLVCDDVATMMFMVNHWCISCCKCNNRKSELRQLHLLLT
jgi:DNA primase